MKSNFLKLGGLLLGGVMFAMVGCTDIKEDISQVAGDVESVKATLAELQGELADAQAEIEDLAKLETEVSGLKSKQSTLEASLKAVETSMNTINSSLSNKADKTALDAAVATVNASIAQINTTVAGLQSSLSDYAKKSEVETVKTNLTTLINEAKTAAADANKAADAAKAVADKATTDLAALTTTVNTLNTTVGTLNTTVSTLSSNLTTLTTRVENAEKDIENLQAEVAKIANIQTSLDKKADQTALDDANKAINEAKDALAAIQVSVDALANQIQSIVFVPEKSHGHAEAVRFNVGGERVSENETINLTFKVAPAKFAEILADDFAKAEANREYTFVLNSVETKAAEADKVVTLKSIAKSANAGRIEVEAIVENTIQDGTYALSLQVEKKASKSEPTTNVSSAYVPVKIVAKDIESWFSIRKKSDKSAYANRDAKVEWSTPAANAIVNYYNGYDVFMKWNDSYITLAEAKKALNITSDITYKYEKAGNVAYTPTNNNGVKVTQVTKDNTLEEALSATFKNDTPMEHVNDKAVMKSKVTVKVSGKSIVINHEDSYEITPRTLTVKLDSKRVDWTYETAKNLSTSLDKSNAYKKSIDKNFRADFGEVKVTNAADIPADLDLNQILSGAVGTTKVNGSSVAAGKVNLDLTAFIEHKLVAVEVASGVYQFPYASGNADKIYNVVQEWYNSDRETKVTFEWQLTLGAIPFVANIGSSSNPYVLGSFEYIPTKQVYNVSSDKILNNSVFNGLKAKFANNDEFLADFANVTVYNGTVTKSAKRYYKKGNTTSNTSVSASFNAVNNTNASAQSYVDFNSKVVDYSDYFHFDTKYVTWYGATFRMYTKATLTKPNYTLGFWTDVVNVTDADNGSVKLKGVYDATLSKWSIVDDNLENYFKVVGANVPATGFTIDYKIVKPTLPDGKTHADLGYVNFPAALETGVVANVSPDANGNPQISSVSTSWGMYTARDMKINATLKYGGIILDDAYVTINIDDPISWKTVDLTATRNATQVCDMNLWNGVQVFGILSPEVNLIDQNGIAFDANIAYGLEVKFINTTEKPVIFKIDGVAQENVPTNKLDLTNLATGHISYHFGNETAESVKPVEIMVPVQVKHNNNYDNVGDYTEVKYIKISIPLN